MWAEAGDIPPVVVFAVLYVRLISFTLDVRQPDSVACGKGAGSDLDVTLIVAAKEEGIDVIM